MYLSYFIVLILIIFIGIGLYNIYRIKYPKKYYLIYTIMATDNEGRIITYLFTYTNTKYYPSIPELKSIVKNTKGCESYTNISIMSYTPISKKQFDRVF